jgi:hypothetical protein
MMRTFASSDEMYQEMIEEYEAASMLGREWIALQTNWRYRVYQLYHNGIGSVGRQENPQDEPTIVIGDTGDGSADSGGKIGGPIVEDC